MMGRVLQAFLDAALGEPSIRSLSVTLLSRLCLERGPGRGGWEFNPYLTADGRTLIFTGRSLPGGFGLRRAELGGGGLPQADQARAVEAIVAVRPNTFYTVTLPCTLWVLRPRQGARAGSHWIPGTFSCSKTKRWYFSGEAI
jgi:hypothetical protein